MIGTITLERQLINKNYINKTQVKTFDFAPDPILENLISALSPLQPWGERKIAAMKLGQLKNPDAVPGLLAALQRDNFWMVRCAIIQALELIKDPRAVPILKEVVLKDGFQVVRSYALKAIERLTS